MRTRKAVIVGAGPVGCLAAICLAKRGWHVELYEGRPDLRTATSKQTTRLRSINLAISHRGLAAIQVVDPLVAERFLQTVIPMKGRMIHHEDCTQCINSIDRALLNESLLEHAASLENTQIFFQHKVQAVDFDRKSMTVIDTAAGSERPVEFDFCIGADGSYSVIRRQLMRVLRHVHPDCQDCVLTGSPCSCYRIRMDFQQEYLKDEYIELRMPAGRDSEGNPIFLLDPSHLHIWPRHSFMFIALPNKDKSFTCTLFAPISVLDRLVDRQTFLSWFKEYFPDALKLIGEDNLCSDWSKNPRSPLICTKSNPYHYLDRAILLGDAAHSMVPFYGQGLNCGLEDVRVLETLLEAGQVSAMVPEGDSIDVALAGTLSKYSETRHADLIAICDLAMANYAEMRHSVTTPGYIFRKALDSILYSVTVRKMVALSSLVPLLSQVPFASGISGWLPLYTMVTFRPEISYATAKRRAERQARILTVLGWTGTAVGLGLMAGLISRGHLGFSRHVRLHR
ncbi:unnamed protein product [Mycena citricolor]|uniref:Kynurenine 3-monooxygenase n=1 Tax=Mycena citricolor TaxID=2018698 RepID=A0AAD2GVU6_9AGAR|nr:unnamed protein product [Mycena citricolor]